MSSITYLIGKKKTPVWLPGTVLEVAAGDLVEIPLLGWVTAGQPVEFSELSETVSVPPDMVHKDTYALRVRGNSMIDDHIQDGDLVIIEQRATAENGQSVVATIGGERVTLKRFYVERDGVRLQPANPDLPPIYLRNEDVQILGIVRGVIRLNP